MLPEDDALLPSLEVGAESLQGLLLARAGHQLGS